MVNLKDCFSFINPFAIDRLRFPNGCISDTKSKRLWIKRVISIGLIGSTAALSLLFLKVIPNDLSLGYRAALLGTTGSIAVVYTSALTYRNIEARSIYQFRHDKLKIFSIKENSLLGFKYDTRLDAALFAYLAKEFPPEGFT